LAASKVIACRVTSEHAQQQTSRDQSEERAGTRNDERTLSRVTFDVSRGEEISAEIVCGRREGLQRPAALLFK